MVEGCDIGGEIVDVDSGARLESRCLTGSVPGHGSRTYVCPENNIKKSGGCLLSQRIIPSDETRGIVRRMEGEKVLKELTEGIELKEGIK